MEHSQYIHEPAKQNEQLILRAEQVSKSYKDGVTAEKLILDKVDLYLHRKESIAIIGRSGSGKTTLLNLLGGLDRPSSGEVILLGRNLASLEEQQLNQLRNQKLGFIFQSHYLLAEFTVLENVCMPRLIAGEDKKTAQAKAKSLLDKVGLGHRVEYKPNLLSGGEKQRVAIARALINQPEIILADEPTGNLDDTTAEQVAELLLSLVSEYKVGLIMVTHDLVLTEKMDKTLNLDSGHLVEF